MTELMNNDKVKSANVKYYREVITNYEKQDKFSPEYKNKVKEKLVKLSKMVNHGKLLDIGSGTGFITELAQGLFDKIYALDSSKEMLELQIQRKIAEPVLAMADNIPFDDETFDICTSSSFVHHLFEFGSSFREIYRVLKPNGIYYINCEPTRIYGRFTYPILRALARKKPEQYSETEKMAEYNNIVTGGISLRELKTGLKGAGFKKIKIVHEDIGSTGLSRRIFGKKHESISKLVKFPPFNYLLFSKIDVYAFK